MKCEGVSSSGKTEPLDTMLADFIAGLEIASENRKKHRLNLEERSRPLAKEAQLREQYEATDYLVTQD